ncbi:hypothetical protein H6G76_26575 [Nostoc sp. FACHB-152]|uniref:hypothetical protein n=1 Tax=unclassified Nostoc TaxID=2593658 RepID=UPI0016870CB8|nr:MULTISPECIES: hypothetical protein [unclassified Nostoc]MBD2450630.1 hypothetical protein [Nostoc sp. FACHB-152]MBD2470098.1 hypothetical protein [Nostoc sp. FACHB-145]
MGKPASPSNDTEFPVEFERAIYQLSSFHSDLSNYIPTWAGVVNRILCVNIDFCRVRSLS